MKPRVMSREEAKQSLKKKFWLRASVFSLITILATLIDEYIKEGYWFNPQDVSKLGTHESIIIVLLVVSVISAVIHKLKGGNDGLAGGGR